MSFLLSLSRDDAEYLTEGWRDSLLSFSVDGPMFGGSADPPMPIIARWWDIERARQAVAPGPDLTVVSVVTDTDESGVPRSTAHRRLRGRVDAILDYLGGEAEEATPAASVTSTCLSCGIKPRARFAARRLVVAGKRQWVPERQSSLCVDCTPEKSRQLLVAA